MSATDGTEVGLLLHLPATTENEADVREFAKDEKACCQFWGFDVAIGDDEITLQWDAPPDATELIERLHEFFLGDEPLTALDGLL